MWKSNGFVLPQENAMSNWQGQGSGRKRRRRSSKVYYSAEGSVQASQGLCTDAAQIPGATSHFSALTLRYLQTLVGNFFRTQLLPHHFPGAEIDLFEAFFEGRINSSRVSGFGVELRETANLETPIHRTRTPFKLFYFIFPGGFNRSCPNVPRNLSSEFTRS
jgi:hypothetical protein